MGVRPRRLQFFPLVHQVADLPHQRLMAIDDGLRCGAVVVETGRRHRALDLANCLLAIGNARFEIVDPRAPRFHSLLATARLRVGAFFLFVRRVMARAAVTAFFTFSRGTFSTRVGPHPHATWLKAVPTRSAAGAGPPLHDRP